MAQQFTHLHTHSPQGSLLDGFMHIEKAVERAKEWGMDSLGISDHGTMAAHLKFNNICVSQGIKPVFGMEAYITPNKAYKKADFDSVEFDILRDEQGLPILNKKEKEQHIFILVKKEEFEAYADEYTDIQTVLPVTDRKKLETESKPLFASLAIERLEETYESIASRLGEKRPLSELKKKEYNVYIKLVTESLKDEYTVGIKGDAAMRNRFSWFPRMSHLLLIALNNEGYHNMTQLNNIAHLEGFYNKPRIDYEDIKKFGKGLAATSACLGGTIPQLILKGKLEDAKKEIELYQNCFDEFYFEVQPSKQEDQLIVNKQLIEWSKEMNIPLIATSDVHMMDHSDLGVHKELMNINKGKGGNTESTEDTSDISVYDSCYFMHPDEFLAAGIPAEALQNAYDLAHRTNVTVLDEKDWRYPISEIPNGEDFDSYLRKLSEQGLFDRFLADTTGKMNWNEYNERLQFELKVIKDKKIPAYFIIVWDFLNYCHSNNILTGPGRGSAAGSLVAYSLGITNIDPIRWNLLFERFLNPERPGFPDIDSDVEGTRRAEVIDYLAGKYGDENIAQIGTYITLSTKSALKDVGRAFGIDHQEINVLNKKIPDGMSLLDAHENVPEMLSFSEKYPNVYQTALEVENMPKTASVHACGLILSPTTLVNSLPLMKGKNGEIVSQYEGPELESIGFIKFDLLGLKNLSIIEGARKLVEERHGSVVDVTTYPFFDDEKVMQLIKKGDTDGVFQLESMSAPLVA